MTGDRVASRRANFEEPTSICVGALFLAACLAGVCIAYAVLSQHGVAGWDESYGYSGYRSAAEQWIETGILRNTRPPGFPDFLALNAVLWGMPSYVTPVIAVQALTTWATLMALFVLARRASKSSAWGLIAVALVSLNLLWMAEAVRNRETFLYSAILMALVSATV